MLNSCDILFDEDLSMKFFAERIGKSIDIILSDGLEASDEVLTDEYKKKIALFINDFEIWYDDVSNAIKDYFNRKGISITLPNDVELMKIFVLFEQNEQGLFGLGFRIKEEQEHGCGLKIEVCDSIYKLIEIGDFDVAFC